MTEGDRCPTCGRPLRPASLFLDPLPPPPEHDHEAAPSPPGPVSPPPPAGSDPTRRPWRWVAATAAVAVLLAAVVMVASPGGDGDTEAEAVSDDSSTTSRPRTATTGRPVVTSTSTTAVLGQLLPERTGVTLLVSGAGGRVFRIALDSGRVERVEATRTGWRDTWAAVTLGDHLLVARHSGVLVISMSDLSVEADIGPGEQFLTGGRRVWMVHHGSEVPVVREVTLERGKIAVGPEVQVPRGAGVQGATADGLVLQLGAQGFLFDPDRRRASPLGAGLVIAAAADRVAAIVCGDDLACRVQVVDLDGAVVATVSPPAGAAFEPWTWGVLSPDGRRLILPVHRAAARPGLLYVDIEGGRTAEHHELSWRGPNVAWAGDWAFVPATDGLFALGPEGRRLVPLADELLGAVEWVVSVPG